MGRRQAHSVAWPQGQKCASDMAESAREIESLLNP